jgi:hypothetical protein
VHRTFLNGLGSGVDAGRALSVGASAPVRRHLGGEPVNAALNPGEPAVDIAQENAGGVWDN